MSEAFTDEDYKRVLKERDSYRSQLDRLQEAIVTSLGQRIEPCMSRHPVTVAMAAGSLIAKIGEAMSCDFEDGDDLLEAVKELVRESDKAREQTTALKGSLSRKVRHCDEITEERDQAIRERDEARAALAACPDCAMYAERSGRFAEQADKLQADLDDCRARNADIRTMLERVTRERDLALGRLENEIKAADQARMAEERARESLDELDAAIYECLPSDYDDDSSLDCVEHAADRLRDLAQERDEHKAKREEYAAEARSLRERLKDAYRERDEARAEAASSLAMARIADEKHGWKCAEVDMLRGVGCMEDGDGPCGACRKCAYRRGAEAMREACQQWCRAWENDGEAIADALADLQVEEP